MENTAQCMVAVADTHILKCCMMFTVGPAGKWSTAADLTQWLFSEWIFCAENNYYVFYIASGYWVVDTP